jgi:undecaprenyl-diphosphatase
MANSEWTEKLLRAEDVITKRMVLPESHKPGIAWAKLISLSCDSWYWLVGLLAIWILEREPWRERAMLTGVAIVLLAVLVLGIKYLVKRQRPEGDWGQVYRALDPHSFPSGHAARAVCIALLGVYFGLGWLAVALIVWAVLVGWSRIALRLHYLVDVLAGWVVGAITTAFAILIFPWVLRLYYQALVILTK